MLSRSKLFEKKSPEKSAALFLIFCEGSYTEPRYFKYFSEINSQIRLISIPADPQSNNSPVGLFESASKAILVSEENPAPEYEIINGIDHVWFVIDTDQWGDKIDELKENALQQNWSVAQSNPCFEVWLYFHHHEVIPDFDDKHLSTEWKKQLDKDVAGGFDHRKHPIYIEKAIQNARAGFLNSENGTIPPCTSVFELAIQFFPFIKKEIDNALAINSNSSK